MKEMKCDETQRRHTFIKYIGITVLALLMLVSTASADAILCKVTGSSYPNPSVVTVSPTTSPGGIFAKGSCPVTFQFNVQLQDFNETKYKQTGSFSSALGEIFPAPDGTLHVILDNNRGSYDFELGTAQVNNGFATLTVEPNYWNSVWILYDDFVPSPLPYNQEIPDEVVHFLILAEYQSPTLKIDNSMPLSFLTGYVMVNGIGDVLYNHDVTVHHVYNSSNVPEFPTIAAPLAAILGLIIVLGRKKND